MFFGQGRCHYLDGILTRLEQSWRQTKHVSFRALLQVFGYFLPIDKKVLLPANAVVEQRDLGVATSAGNSKVPR